MSRSAYIALVGRPNVGKSTLLNRLVGQKISITAPRPQTTRHKVLGIATRGDVQLLFVDTPGLHRVTPRALNKYLNRTAGGVFGATDTLVQLVEALRWTDDDELVASLMGKVPVERRLLVVNKVDTLPNKRELLPFLAKLGERGLYAEMIPLSARTGSNVDDLERKLAELAPTRAWLYPENQVTDISERFLAAELVREKLTRLLRQELPYSLTVEVERFEEEGNLLRIAAVIWVERPGQKAIVIGQNGRMLREAGQQARGDMERAFNKRVFLQTWVKVREGWADDDRALRTLGYGDGS
jgi:GTP-binding protein Era